MEHMLTQIASRPCEVMFCSNFASWAIDGTAVCEECMENMSRMNNDNEEVFRPALNTFNVKEAL